MNFPDTISTDVWVEHVIGSLSPSDVMAVMVTHDTLATAFMQYVRSGMYFYKLAGGLRPDRLFWLEAALLPFDPREGYPPVYHLIREAYAVGLIDYLPVQVKSMTLIDDIEEYDPTNPILHDRKLVMEFPWLYEFASPEIRSDKEVVLATIDESYQFYPQMTDELKYDKDIALVVTARDGSMIAYMSDCMRDDFDVGLSAVQNMGWTIQHLSDRLRENKDIVIAALLSDGEAELFISDILLSDPDIHRVRMGVDNVIDE